MYMNPYKIGGKRLIYLGEPENSQGTIENNPQSKGIYKWEKMEGL